MRHHLFTALCLLTLATSFALFVLWVASMQRPVWVGRLSVSPGPASTFHRETVGFVCFGGRVSLWLDAQTLPTSGSQPVVPRSEWTLGNPPTKDMVYALTPPHWLGDFGLIRYPGGWQVLIPSWLPTILTAVLASYLLARSPIRLAANRLSHGLCPRCGYDLRGSSAGGAACPECGAAVSSRVAKA